MEMTHFDEYGKAYMVDVSQKAVTDRTAVAAGKIKVSPQVYEAVEKGRIGKGDVLGVAATAGTIGVKKTFELIPMCHIIPVTHCHIEFDLKPEDHEIHCFCTVKTVGRTGIEMEALTGVSVALLTVYDMCKALDKRMIISDIHLMKKTGGKSGTVDNSDIPL